MKPHDDKRDALDRLRAALRDHEQHPGEAMQYPDRYDTPEGEIIEAAKALLAFTPSHVAQKPREQAGPCSIYGEEVPSTTPRSSEAAQVARLLGKGVRKWHRLKEDKGDTEYHIVKDVLQNWPVIEAALTASAASAIRQSRAATDVLAERQRQVEKEGWSHEHDDGHSNGAMAVAGACYALTGACVISDEAVSWRDRYAASASGLWPWDMEWFKPRPKDPRRDLVRAAALIVAEIERIDRTKNRADGGKQT